MSIHIDFFMCWNNQYQVNYDINPWMDDQFHQVNNKKAFSQWESLVNILKDLDAKVEVLMVDDNSVPDIVFTANAGMVHSGLFIPSNFRYHERDGEVLYYMNWFLEHTEFQINVIPETFEGAGDALKDTYGNLWMGHGFRSKFTASESLRERYTYLEIKTLELANPKFYHLDTCFCPLLSGHALYYPKAFYSEGIKHMKDVFGKKLIEVNEDDAKRFACNAVEWNNNIILNGCSPMLNFALEDAGYNVIELDLSEFIKAGGSAKCLTIRLS